MAATRVEVERIPPEQKELMRDLLDDYLRELARLEGAQPEMDQVGRPAYTYFDDYWLDSDRFPLGIYSDRRLVGFCLLRDDGEAWQVAEFFIRTEIRRRKIGAAAVDQIKQQCRVLGRHQELRAKVARWNHPSRAFWLSQGFEVKGEDADGIVTAASL